MLGGNTILVGRSLGRLPKSSSYSSLSHHKRGKERAASIRSRLLRLCWVFVVNQKLLSSLRDSQRSRQRGSLTHCHDTTPSPTVHKPWKLRWKLLFLSGTSAREQFRQDDLDLITLFFFYLQRFLLVLHFQRRQVHTHTHTHTQVHMQSYGKCQVS